MIERDAGAAPDAGVGASVMDIGVAVSDSGTSRFSGEVDRDEAATLDDRRDPVADADGVSDTLFAAFLGFFHDDDATGGGG